MHEKREDAIQSPAIRFVLLYSAIQLISKGNFSNVYQTY